MKRFVSEDVLNKVLNKQIKNLAIVLKEGCNKYAKAVKEEIFTTIESSGLVVERSGRYFHGEVECVYTERGVVRVVHIESSEDIKKAWNTAKELSGGILVSILDATVISEKEVNKVLADCKGRVFISQVQERVLVSESHMVHVQNHYAATISEVEKLAQEIVSGNSGIISLSNIKGLVSTREGEVLLPYGDTISNWEKGGNLVLIAGATGTGKSNLVNILVEISRVTIGLSNVHVYSSKKITIPEHFNASELKCEEDLLRAIKLAISTAKAGCAGIFIFDEYNTLYHGESIVESMAELRKVVKGSEVVVILSTQSISPVGMRDVNTLDIDKLIYTGNCPAVLEGVSADNEILLEELSRGEVLVYSLKDEKYSKAKVPYLDYNL